MPWLAIGAGASVVSGIGNMIANSDANSRAKMLQDQALQQWLKINIPDPEQQKVVLDKFVQQGTLDPVLQTAIKQDPSEFQKIVTNSQNQAAQNRALSEMEDIGNNGGLRLQDKAALQDAQMHQQVQDRANRMGISADMERRGMGGSGFDVAAQLQGQQGTSDQAASNSLKVAADAQNRALQSIEGAGNLATQYRTQDFNEQAQKAGAADRINQFNTQNLRDVNAANTGMANRDNELNLATKQNISDSNTKLANSQQMYNKGLTQQQFDNQAKIAAGVGGQYNNEANTAEKSGQITGNTISNIGGAAAGAASSMANQNFWDEYFKKKSATANSGSTT